MERRSRRVPFDRWLRGGWMSISYRQKRLLFKVLIGLITGILAVLSAWALVSVLY